MEIHIVIEAKIIGTIHPKNKDSHENPCKVLSCALEKCAVITPCGIKERDCLYGTDSTGAYYHVISDDYNFIAEVPVEENLKQIKEHKAAIKELELLVDKQMNPHGYFKKEWSKSEMPSDTTKLRDNIIYNFNGIDYSMVRWDIYNDNLVCSFEPLKKVHYAENTRGKK